MDFWFSLVLYVTTPWAFLLLGYCIARLCRLPVERPQDDNGQDPW